MQAVVFEQHGGPDQLHTREYPDPVPGPGEVVIDVKACALNRLDLLLLRGHPSWMAQTPHAPGSDVAGRVSKLGEGVTTCNVGDRVLVSPGLSCFTCAFCRAGNDHLCTGFSIVGAKRWGGYADKVCVPASSVLPIGSEIPWQAAAAFPLTYLTAWHMLVSKARLASGEYVLIMGASGGIGIACLQIARHLGARVMAVVGDKSKIAALRALGAEVVTDRTAESVPHVARAWTQKRGVDVAIEPVGSATWTGSIGSLAPEGRLVTCGHVSPPQVTIDVAYLYARELSILGAHIGTRAELEVITALLHQKSFSPVIARTYGFHEASEALRQFEKHEHVGKIVLVKDPA
jgi:NADPH:quinone reductase-like Zn-dependent oxidoreductase